MRILCFTDNLGSGGSQRQLTFLAVLLKARGHEVLLVTYNDGEHFTQELTTAGVSRVKLDDWPKWARPIAVRRVMNEFRPDGVIAFQEAPSLYAEIASSFGKQWRLIASERNAVPPEVAENMTKLIRQFHRFADVVTTNSVTNRWQIESAVPSLRERLVTIYNAVDLLRFCPSESRVTADTIRFIVLSSHKPQKNFRGLAHAVRLLMSEPCTFAFSIDWFGDEAPGWLARDMACCESLGVGSVIHFHPATKAPEAVLDAADALILPSLWEGLSNSVCEALSVGCPVLISDVADARFLVEEGVTGFLFDPTSPDCIANTIRRFMSLSAEQRSSMRVEARKFAERTFDPVRFVTAYELVLAGKEVVQMQGDELTLSVGEMSLGCDEQ